MQISTFKNTGSQQSFNTIQISIKLLYSRLLQLFNLINWIEEIYFNKPRRRHSIQLKFLRTFSNMEFGDNFTWYIVPYKLNTIFVYQWF